jgi:anaerobic magnesium-protoporphyrin IX monomethyl ester cyclase
MKTDCLIIGYNDSDFEDYVRRVKAIGPESENVRELRLSYFEHEGRSYHAMGVLNRFYNEHRTEGRRVFFHAEFLWACITTIASHLWRHGLTFDFVNLYQREREALAAKLRTEDVRTVAVTTTLYVSPEPVMEVVREVRAHNRTARIVVGGPYIYNQSKLLDRDGLEFLFRRLGADFYVISQEGEDTLVRLIQALKAGRPPVEVPNVAFLDDGGRLVRGPVAVEDNALAENRVNYGLFSPGDLGQFVSLRTAKSCPFACSFCGHPEMAGQYRYLDVADVERELDGIRAAADVLALDFVDDTFNVPKPRFKELMRMMIRKNYGFRWISYLRADHADAEAIELMGQAGCAGVFLGVESGSDAMLKAMNKTSRRKDYARAIPALQAAGVLVHANLIAGFPGETFATIAETIDFLETARPDFYRAQIWYCDPTTPVWRQREALKIRGAAYKWSHGTMHSRTAADLRERIYLSVEHSTWLPDYAFEVFCLLYLQRLGMTVDQVRTFLRCFNAVVRDRLLFGASAVVPDTMLGALRAACQYDREGTVRVVVPAAYGAGRYRAAESYWTSRFRDGGPAPAAEAIRAVGATAEPGWISEEGPWVEWESPRIEADLALVAAGAVVFARLGGRHEVAALVVRGERDRWLPVPARVAVGGAVPAGRYVDTLAADLDQARHYGLYGLFVVSNPTLMAVHGATCPRIDVAFVEGADVGAEAARMLEERLAHYPGVGAALTLIVQLSPPDERSGRRRMAVTSRAGALGRAALRQLGEAIVRLREQIVAAPDLLVERLEVGGASVVEEPATESSADAAATFRF